MINLPTDSELVDCAAATYALAAQPFFEDADKAIRIFLTKRSADGLNILAVEGTHDPLGWLIDFFAAKIDDQQGLNSASLGFIHAGFYASAVAALTRCALVAAKGPYAICGHSLGAGLALLIGSLLLQDDLPPVKIGAFAPPKVGGATFVKVVTSIPFCAYRYGNDPVTGVPLTFMDFPYEQVPLTEIGSAMIDPFRCHAIGNYVAGVKAKAA